MAFPAGMPIDEEIVMGVGKSARNRIDSMIRKGVMPNIAGQPTLDAATGMAKGVKKPVVAAPKTSFMKSAGGGAVLASVPSMVMQGIQAFNKNIPDAAVAHPLEFIGTGLGQAAARMTLPKSTLDAADAANVSAYQGTRFDPNAQLPAEGASLIPEAAASALPPSVQPQPAPEAVDAAVAPAAPIANPATPEQQTALLGMGITQPNVINHGAGVDLATARQIERQGRYGGKDGKFTQLHGYGDQNSVYAKASRPGGKINEFYGAGTGKASTPGSMRLNVVSSQGVMAPDSGAAVSGALNDAANRGDWGAVERYYAKQGQGFGGKAADQGSDLKAQLADVMAMPTNTFGQIAAKRAAMAALNKGIHIADLDARTGLAQSRNAMDLAKIWQDIEASGVDLADKRRVSSLRDKILNEKDQGKRAALVQELNLLTGKNNDATGREIIQGDNGVFLVDKVTGASMAMQGITPKKSAEARPGVTADGIGGFVISTPDGVYAVNQQGEKKQVFSPAHGNAAGNSFATPAEAEAAYKAGKIKAGDKIIVGGVSGTWQ